MGKVKFTTNIDKELLKQVKIKAVKEDVHLNRIIEKTFGEFLKEEWKMFKLVEVSEGERKELIKSELADIVNYLKENEEIYNWVQDEDPEMELPELENVETLRELEAELKKVNLDWWELKIEKC